MAKNRTVDNWMASLEPSLRDIAEALQRVTLNTDPDLTEAIKWGNPTYEKDGKVCYLAAGNGYISLGFFNGASLSDPDGRIEGTGKKMRHVKVRSLADVNAEQIAAWVREAVALNQG